MKRYEKIIREDKATLNEEWLAKMIYNTDISKLRSKVSEAIQWDITTAYAFCVALLEDVNAHTEAKFINDYFVKELNRYGMNPN